MAKGAAREAWLLLVELMTSELRRVPEIAAEFDLSAQQVYTLRAVAPEQPLPMSALAGVLGCDASNVTGLVDRLERRGLLARRPSSGDRRVKLLALTEEGARLRAALLERIAEPPASLSGLAAEDQRALRDILRRALQAAER